MSTYNIDDSAYEIVIKNKRNIIILLEEIKGFPPQADFDALVKLVGDYSQDVANNLDETKSVIENLSIVASNLNASLLRIKSNEEAILKKADSTYVDSQLALKENKIDATAKFALKADETYVDAQDKALDNRVQQLETNGIGGYLGTYQGANADDSSELPNPANDLERAIIEFPSGDSYNYQEYEWKNDQWNKLGQPTDSHIHSQSAGITLQDVANQQDPKIAKKATLQEVASQQDPKIAKKTSLQEVLDSIQFYFKQNANVYKGNPFDVDADVSNNKEHIVSINVRWKDLDNNKYFNTPFAKGNGTSWNMIDGSSPDNSINCDFDGTTFTMSEFASDRVWIYDISIVYFKNV